eukprot:5896833-Lingulodinium_polyedra.AAC.1
MLAPPNGFDPKGTCTPWRRIMLATLAGDATRVRRDTRKQLTDWSCLSQEIPPRRPDIRGAVSSVDDADLP